MKLREQVKERDLGLCQTCRRKGHVTAGTECDHIVPVFEGGEDVISNLEMICSDCHKDKTAAEAARARGFKFRPKKKFGLDGWPE